MSTWHTLSISRRAGRRIGLEGEFQALLKREDPRHPLIIPALTRQDPYRNHYFKETPTMSQKAATARTSEPQHLVALARANRVRLARAAMKREIAAGETQVAQVLLEGPWEVESMTVADLLACQRRWGVTRCRRFLAKSRISETRTVGTLTQRQRDELAERLSAEPSLSAVGS